MIGLSTNRNVTSSVKLFMCTRPDALWTRSPLNPTRLCRPEKSCCRSNDSCSICAVAMKEVSREKGPLKALVCFVTNLLLRLVMRLIRRKVWKRERESTDQIEGYRSIEPGLSVNIYRLLFCGGQYVNAKVDNTVSDIGTEVLGHGDKTRNDAVPRLGGNSIGLGILILFRNKDFNDILTTIAIGISCILQDFRIFLRRIKGIILLYIP